MKQNEHAMPAHEFQQSRHDEIALLDRVHLPERLVENENLGLGPQEDARQCHRLRKAAAAVRARNEWERDIEGEKERKRNGLQQNHCARETSTN